MNRSAAFLLALSTILTGQTLHAEQITKLNALELVQPANLSTTGNSARVIRVQNANIPPHCSAWTIVVHAPSYATASSTVSASGFLSQCGDPDGDALTVTSPGTPYTFTLQPNQWSLSVPFSVSDGRGGTAGAVLTIQRQ